MTPDIGRLPWPLQVATQLRPALAMIAGASRLPDEMATLIAAAPGLAALALGGCGCLPGRRGGTLPTLDACLEDLGVSRLKGILLDAARAFATGNPPATQDQESELPRQACSLATRLALDMGYASPHEAGLAGLLDISTDMSEISSPDERADWVERWGYAGFLADALRYAHLPADELEDAVPLVRITAATRALLLGQAPRLEEAAHLTGLDPSRVAELAAQSTQTPAGYRPASDESAAPEDCLTHCLVPYTLTESYAVLPPDQRGLALAEVLRAGFGLHHPLLLEADAAGERLNLLPLGGETVPDLAMRATGHHLAARSLRAGCAQSLSAAQSVDNILDRQLLRWADADYMLAIPQPAGASVRVLLVFGDPPARPGEAPALPFLERLLTLTEWPATESAPPPRPGPCETSPEWQISLRQVVHEINNPLGIIKNYLAILRVKLGDNPAIGEELRIIHEELDRVARIAGQLVSEPAGQDKTGEEVDVNLLLEDLIRVSEPGMMAHKQVRLETRLDPELPRPRVDRDRLKQLLLNLLLNAIEAAPHASTVAIETHRVIGMQRETQLEMLVSNAGHPIRPDVLARLFDPQDSQKGGGHAGLGLAIVKSLALDLHANVNCRSYNGLTTFQVLLPLT